MLASPQLENECGSQQYDVRKTIREAELNEMGEEIMQWPNEAKNSRGFGLMSKEAGDGEKRLESGNDPPNQTLELKSQTARAIRQDGRDLFGTAEETQPERLESEAMSFALQVERIAEENGAKLAGLRKERDELKLKVAELEKDLQDSAEVKRVVHDALQLCEEMKDGLLQLAELSAKETSRLQCRIKELEEELAKERSRLDEVCKQKYHELENVSNESDTLLGQAAQQEGLTSKCTQTHVNRKATLWNMSGCPCEQQVVFEEADSREVIELEEQDALGSRLKVEENGCPAIGETRKREKVDGLNEQMMCAIDPEVDSKSKAMSAESDRLRTELDQGRLDLEVLNTSSHQGASLEQELNMVRAGRGAAIAALNIELAASRAAYESKSTALLEAERRIAHLELQLTNKSDLAYAVVRDASISSQDKEEIAELRGHLAMLESENERMGAACDEADDEIKNLREEVSQLREKIAGKDALSSEEVDRCLHNVRPLFSSPAEEIILSSEGNFAVDNDTLEKMANVSRSSKTRRPESRKLKLPWKRSKTPKMDGPDGKEHHLCRTQ